MLIAGRNEEHQISEKSNQKGPLDIQCVSPPINSILNIPQILSFSIYSLHSVWVENTGRAFGVGYNGDGSMLATLPKGTFRVEHEIIINDQEGNKCMLLSAMCGSTYTLYLVSGQNGSNNELVYNSSKSSTPLFLNLNGFNPIRLFGGNKRSAAIDNKGRIILITDKILDSPTEPIQPFSLPNEAKAISVSCCDDYILALDSEGQIYENSYRDFNLINFKKKVVEISGSFEHCFVVCEDGSVFCRGSNDFVQLGIVRKPAATQEFIEVLPLKKIQITSAYAGYSHSLFQTSDGMILACGLNQYGELLLESGPCEEKIYTPVETMIKDGAYFCIAGQCISAVFNEYDPPPKTPNIKVFNNS